MARARDCAQRLLWWLLKLYLVASLIAVLLALMQLLRRCLRQAPRRPDEPTPSDSGVVPEWAVRDADPLIYSQPWLLARGLAVTWQNPDVHLELPSAPGVAVDTWQLAPDTVYDVFARVWNGSTEGPVAGLPVRFSYLDFGIGGVSVPIADDEVNLPVKGAAGTPAIASVAWRTPPAPGHYCLQVLLDWPYDADPGNNLGQHNVEVKALNSPQAAFIVPVRNHGRRPIDVRLTVDAYALQPLRPCEPPEPDRDPDHVRRAHGPEAHPVPEGWTVALGEAGQGVPLQAGETADVTVTMTAPVGFAGRQAINLNGWDGNRLLGGVTLIAEGDADA